MNAIVGTIERSSSAGLGGAAIVEFLRGRLDRCTCGNESLHALFLDRDRRFVGEKSICGTDMSRIRTRSREIFSEALAARATGLILAHNHPSGRCEPSQADIEATRKLTTIANALDIELLDHLIITTTSAFSMRAGGLL